MKNVLSRGVDVYPHPKHLKLGGSNWAYGRDHGAFKALPQLDFPTEGACDIAKPSNLGRACEGDRVDLASSHFGNDSDHARIVNFRSIDIWEHGIRFCPGAFEEFQEFARSNCPDIAARPRDAR